MTIRFWKSTCRILAGVKRRRIIRYSLQYGKSRSPAPSPRMISSMQRTPVTAIHIPRVAPQNTIRAKSWDASLSFPSPIFLAMTALPPVASMVPSPTMMLITGVTMLIADRASVFTKRDTKIVSPMV